MLVLIRLPLSLGGCGLHLEYDETSTILDIKKKIFEEFDISVDSQVIILAGQALLDNDQPYQLKLSEVANIHLMIKRPKQEDRKETLKGTLFDKSDQQKLQAVDEDKKSKSKKSVRFST